MNKECRVALANQRDQSLNRFLKLRYLAVLVLLIITFIITIVFMRHGAMDDTTDYYMHYDAQVLSEHYQLTDDIAEFDLGIKEYYWSTARLPLYYQNLLGITDNTPQKVMNKTHVYQLDNQYIYILPYYSTEKGEVFYVIHLFDVEHEAAFYQSWQNVFILFVTVLLALVIFYSVHTNREITQQVAGFDAWIHSLSQLNYHQLKRHQRPDSVTFNELVNSANTLQSSLLKQFELQATEQVLLSREKYFLSSLSHELRTPISIISAASALLNKSEHITAKDSKTLLKLHTANLTMKQLTNTLLRLWQGQQHSDSGQKHSLLVNKVFLFDELVESAVASAQQQFERKNINFMVNMTENIKLLGQFELTEILVSNLIRNACQYSSNARVKVDLHSHDLLIENMIDASNNNENNVASNEVLNSSTKKPDYGYGLGLFLAEKICQQLQWQLQISSNENIFKVKVSFNEN